MTAKASVTTFDRWTDRARRSVMLAQEQARMLSHPEIGTAHMLLGLIAEGGGVAYQALTALGAGLDDARKALEKYRPSGREPHPGHLPFTARGKKACELAFREALQLGCNYVGCEHVLLGLIREGEGSGADVLVALGINPGDARAKVLELLAGYGKAEKPPPAGPEPASVAYEDLLASIWLYIPWHYVTRQLTTPQKELFADAIDAFHARANADDPGLDVSPVERWWRDGG